MKNPCRKTNTVFLIMTITYLAVSVFLSMLSVRSIKPPVAASLIFGELIVVIPGMIFLLINKCDMSEWLPFKKVKKSTVGFTILLTMTVMPLLYFLNMLSQLLEENVAIDLLNKIDGVPGIFVFFIVGIFGPVCEEVAFRGILFGGFKRSGKVFAAVLWSGFLFGLFHMNLNQFGYAFAMGIISAMLIEVSGSMWPSVIMHVIINSYNVIELYLAEFIYDKMGIDFGEIAKTAEAISKDDILRLAALLLLPAVGGVAVSIVIFNAIMNREGRREYVLGFLPKRKSQSRNNDDNTLSINEEVSKDRVISFSGILGAAICIFMIFAMEYILKYFGV